jgi:hypothetical protein
MFPLLKYVHCTGIGFTVVDTAFADCSDCEGVTRYRNRIPEQITRIGIEGPEGDLLAPLPVVADKHIDCTGTGFYIVSTTFADRSDHEGITRQRNRSPEQITCTRIEGPEEALLAPSSVVVTDKHIDRTGIGFSVVISTFANRSDR